MKGTKGYNYRSGTFGQLIERTITAIVSSQRYVNYQKRQRESFDREFGADRRRYARVLRDEERFQRRIEERIRYHEANKPEPPPPKPTPPLQVDTDRTYDFKNKRKILRAMSVGETTVVDAVVWNNLRVTAPRLGMRITQQKINDNLYRIRRIQ